MPKISVGKPLSVSLISGIEKMLAINHKNYWQGRDSNPEPTAWEPCCPKPAAVNYFWIKSWQFWSDKKRKTTLLNNFSCIFHILRKITRGAVALRDFPSTGATIDRSNIDLIALPMLKIIITIALCISWHYQFIRALKQSRKPAVFPE